MKITQNLMRVKELLLKPPTFSDNQARLQTNLDTDFLKLIAIVSMLMDHIGSVFFPEVRVLRWIGRLAFPIFCYCMTVGLLYTHDIKKYLFRLGIFALISQPCYILAFHPYDFWAQFTNWNIFFTLFLSLLAMYGWKERKWWLFSLTFFVISWWNFDYSSTGIFLMLVFYLCRNNPVVGPCSICCLRFRQRFSSTPVSFGISPWVVLQWIGLLQWPLPLCLSSPVPIQT